MCVMGRGARGKGEGEREKEDGGGMTDGERERERESPTHLLPSPSPPLQPPPAESMLQGVELLYALGAINNQCELTQPLGLQMAEFPLNPMFARMLLLSGTCICYAVMSELPQSC